MPPLPLDPAVPVGLRDRRVPLEERPMAEHAVMEVSLLQGRVKKALLRQAIIASQGVLPRASVVPAMPIRSVTDGPGSKSKGREFIRAKAVRGIDRSFENTGRKRGWIRSGRSRN
jgi:hypothetical protein